MEYQRRLSYLNPLEQLLFYTVNEFAQTTKTYHRTFQDFVREYLHTERIDELEEVDLKKYVEVIVADYATQFFKKMVDDFNKSHWRVVGGSHWRVVEDRSENI